MSLRFAIIASFGLGLLSGSALAAGPVAATPVSAEAGVIASPAATAYQVRLDIVRNGVALGSPESTLDEGEPGSVTLPAGRYGADLRVTQRVTPFPGARDSKALLELELFSASAGRMKRLMAPTLGVVLGRSAVYELPTDQGLMRIRAWVVRVNRDAAEPANNIKTIAYPSFL